MIKNGLSIFLFLSIISCLQAQFRFDRFDAYSLKKDSTSKHFISISTENYYQSNAVTNSAVMEALYVGFISDEVKEDTYKKLKEKNELGTIQVYDLNYKYNLDCGNLTFRFRDRTINDFHFSDNFFKTVLGGNKQFAGQNIKISPLDYTKLSYQSLMLGYEKNLEESGWFFGGGLSVVKGGESKVIQMDDAYLYTAEYGDSLIVEGNMHFHGSPKEGTRFSRANGWGLALDLYASKQVTDKLKINFDLQDLGKVWYEKLDNYYRADTTIVFDGVEIDQNFQIADSVCSNIQSTNLESLLGLNPQPQKVAYTLPALIHLNAEYKLNDRYLFTAGLRYLLLRFPIPQFYLRTDISVGKRWQFAPILSYGGFSTTDFGIAAMYNFHDWLYAHAEIFYLEALLAPKKTASQGVGLTLSALF